MMAKRVFAVIPAAGIGSRMQAEVPKQYLPLAGGYLADHTLSRLLAVDAIDAIQVALHPRDSHWSSLQYAAHPRVAVCDGGESRAQSVLLALRCLQQKLATRDDDWVLVHDMARPCVRGDDIRTLLSTHHEQGALLALPAIDTMKQAVISSDVSADVPTLVANSLDRNVVWRALTPQFFPLHRLVDILSNALQAGVAITDEASAMEWAGAHPELVHGHADNIKVTHSDDLPLAEFFIQQQKKTII